MGCGFGREVAHRHIFSDVNNLLLREPHPPVGLGSPRVFHSNGNGLDRGLVFRHHCVCGW